mgnify:CR=1 FL=1
MKERLQKIIAAAGICSRRAAEDLLRQGRVQVNGQIAALGDRADPETDAVTLDGQPLSREPERVYLMLNKPRGYVTTLSDERGRRTAAELVSGCGARVYPVGRLDRDSEGLLLFTNDGELLHRLISPKKEVAKVYYARHEGQANADDISAFAAGLTLRDGTVCLPALLEPLGPGESRITVREGKYHQVRRMMASRNMTVTYLERRQEGTLTLGDLPRGRTRELTEGEIALLEGKTQP